MTPLYCPLCLHAVKTDVPYVMDTLCRHLHLTCIIDQNRPLDILAVLVLPRSS